MTWRITQACLLFAQQHFRSTTILQWAENLVKVSIWRNIHDETLQAFTIFNRIIDGLIDISDFEVGRQIVNVMLEEATQPCNIVPLPKN